MQHPHKNQWVFNAVCCYLIRAGGQKLTLPLVKSLSCYIAVSFTQVPVGVHKIEHAIGDNILTPKSFVHVYL